MRERTLFLLVHSFMRSRRREKDPMIDSLDAKSRGSPATTRDLRPSERRFVSAMHQLGFGRFESLEIKGGELVLDPWPTVVRVIKFGTPAPSPQATGKEEFELKKQVADM